MARLSGTDEQSLATWGQRFLGMVVVTSLDALFVLRRDRRALHDLVAGTRVIRA